MEDTQVGKDLIDIGITVGIEKGMEKGKHLLITRMLRHKFGTVPKAITNRINAIKSDERLEEIALKIGEVRTLEQLQQFLKIK